ncbi:hypothetical protein AMJ87_08485 [candidate division WOR_3 bacterium SM23_60]|uniref:histidine kinase n=1 Tax=candidate division WOR_3 bacterium SM23_60 TaxID=1703780 RepID=A0A0S8GGG2_UNCW3|nr:MAG: hypothetical protein AMJ87_08485 [candidate division WOR_3 bacterium SM23_60]
MKVRTLILIFIIACVILFAVLTVRFTNYNLKKTFRESSHNSFYLLSFVVDHLYQHEKVAEKTVIERLREKIIAAEDRMLLRLQNDRDIQGVWTIEAERVTGMTEYGDAEKDIISFYRKNLEGKNAHTLILLDGKPFFLVNTARNRGEVLLLSDASGIYGIQIEQILDSLIASSSLRYFAIIDTDNTPILFSTLYENFLPLMGAGEHIIETPQGKIFQIEQSTDAGSIIAGFEMESLSKILRNNNVFLMLIIVVFVIMEGVLFASYAKFERFRVRKEREINKFKEVSVLSTGFAHEFRNSLYTLSLLAKELDEKNKRILLDETNRMTTIMDSLRLLSTKEVKRDRVMVLELMHESVAVLDHILTAKKVTVHMDINEDTAIQGNRPLLVTAFSNIIKNGIEASARNIKITSHRKGRKIHVTIADDGTGIDPSIIDEIYDPFFSKKGQSGIGLYLTKRIIELHGGEIELKRNTNTFFTVTLST